MNQSPQAGWYPDPEDGSHLDERYWNGQEWTDLTRLAEGGPAPDAPTQQEPPVTALEQAVGPEQVLVTLGEIHCTASTVMTPNGSFPIRGTDWGIHDGSSMTRRIPPYAIVLAILLTIFTCGLALLFLLIQENVYTGKVDVTVRDKAGNYFATSIPVRHDGTVADVHTRVNYCRHFSQM